MGYLVSKIIRNIENSANEQFDIIIIGGGIYGIMLALESGFRHKRALLLERDDFGGATSFNHLRTLHGGLRYLQSADLERFFESIQERKWFLTYFPQLCGVLPCIMPLYGKGLRRNPILRIAVFINDFLSRKRNISVISERHLPKGSVISKELTKKIFPNVNSEGLKGSALWYDGMMPEQQRLSIEILRWACDLGATALNYVSVEGLLNNNSSTTGVKSVDRESGEKMDFRAPVVINAAGPWCRKVARNFDRDYPVLFNSRILNWNILFKREALSDHALALTPHKGAGHTYFFHNWKNRLLIGTGEEPIDDSSSNNFPTEKQVNLFIDDVNSAVPGLSLSRDEIEHIYSGILPGTGKGKLTKKEVIICHEDNSGPKGLFSVSGVKYTTSRLVAEKTLNIIYPRSENNNCQNISPPKEANSKRGIYDFNWMPLTNDKKWLHILKRLIEDESVFHLDDLLLRRTSLGENAERIPKIIPQIRNLFKWDDYTWEKETEHVKKYTNIR